jgi:WD40 repeat protein
MKFQSCDFSSFGASPPPIPFFRMWSLESYECLRIFLNEDAIFLSVACTHDGVLTGSSDGIVRFWEVDTAETPVGKGALSPQSRKQVGSQGRKASDLVTLGCTQA